jgi:hypothetical protein
MKTTNHPYWTKVATQQYNGYEISNHDGGVEIWKNNFPIKNVQFDCWFWQSVESAKQFIDEAK